MLSRERADAPTPLHAALDPEQRDAVRLPLHSEPAGPGYLLLGWCLLNRRLDPRCVAIEFIEVPVEVRKQGLGRALLDLLAEALPEEVVLPHDPRADCLPFWLGVAPPALGRLVGRLGEAEARALCTGTLEWPEEFFDALLAASRAGAGAAT